MRVPGLSDALARLAGIVDRSIGMYVLRQMLGRGEWEPPTEAGEAGDAGKGLESVSPGRPTVRPTRLVVSGESRRGPALVRGSTSTRLVRSAPTRGRILRDTSGVLLAMAGVILFAVFLVPREAGVLGTTAEPRFPAAVTLESGFPAATGFAGPTDPPRLEPLSTEPPVMVPPPSPEPTPSPTAQASPTPTAVPRATAPARTPPPATAAPPPPTQPPTPPPTAPSTPRVTLAPPSPSPSAPSAAPSAPPATPSPSASTGPPPSAVASPPPSATAPPPPPPPPSPSEPTPSGAPSEPPPEPSPP